MNVSDTEEGIVFRDVCSGPHCNDDCPEEILLDLQNAEVWPLGTKIVISLIVVGIAVICLLGKVRHVIVT